MNIKFQTIDQKELDSFGDTDLLSRVKSLRDVQVDVLELVRIDKLTAMRLDLFCQAYYGSVADLELFLFINGIVNPFEEPLGKVLIMPNMDKLKASIRDIDINAVEHRNKEIAMDPNKNKVSTNGVSRMTNRKPKADTTRSIGFRKLDNGNLIF